MSEINLNELLAKANTGDTNAMQQLIEYYDKINDEDNASFWNWKSAAKKLTAITLMQIPLKILEAYSSQYIGAWELAKDDYTEVLNSIEEVQKRYDSGDVYSETKDINSLQEHRQSVYYGLAVIAYMRDHDVTTALQHLMKGRCNSSRAKALLGICQYENNNYPMAFKNLDDVYWDRDYLYCNKGVIEESILAYGIDSLASMYRIGIKNVVSRDITQAFTILNNGINAIHDVDLREKLSVERSHYKKALFGGYIYRTTY